ncbi:hypothetical protein CWATWH0401_2397, partial [Crocosphaera watsonii WH 0401]
MVETPPSCWSRTNVSKRGATFTAPRKFELPFEGKLSPNNRWVIMAELIPWD